MRIIRLIIAYIFCIFALLMPYSLRMLYVRILAFLVHLPYILFGFLTRTLFKKLSISHNDIKWE